MCIPMQTARLHAHSDSVVKRWHAGQQMIPPEGSQDEVPRPTKCHNNETRY